MTGLRHSKVFIQPDGFQTVTVINFPEDYTYDQLKSIFVPSMPIVSCVVIPKKSLEKGASWPQVKTRAEITFRSHSDAKDACSLDGVKIGNTKLQVKPSKQ